MEKFPVKLSIKSLNECENESNQKLEVQKVVIPREFVDPHYATVIEISPSQTTIPYLIAGTKKFNETSESINTKLDKKTSTDGEISSSSYHIKVLSKIDLRKKDFHLPPTLSAEIVKNYENTYNGISRLTNLENGTSKLLHVSKLPSALFKMMDDFEWAMHYCHVPHELEDCSELDGIDFSETDYEYDWSKLYSLEKYLDKPSEIEIIANRKPIKEKSRFDFAYTQTTGSTQTISVNTSRPKIIQKDSYNIEKEVRDLLSDLEKCSNKMRKLKFKKF